MANLNLIKSFNQRYEKTSPIRNYNESTIVNESFDADRIEKAFQDEIANLGPNFTRYFDFGLPTNAVLLFIDVCNFSTRKGHLNGEEIANYFDAYYDKIIPTIYKYGGEIEKIIGDGIICVFAPPFLDKEIEDLLDLANQCATEIIEKTKGTEYTSKVAIHSGKINYFKNKSGFYQEYTIIGKPLTELFRLESVSNNECVNFYADSPVHELHKEEIERNIMMGMIYSTVYGPYSRHNAVGLKGVDFSAYYSLKI